ncbi:MAG: hypothetical protein J6C98_07720 [Oscillospiraceae bacterium]|nr:hypothetical protein [Oscillospiraceae bacterium]
MGLFNFLKKKQPSASDQAAVDSITASLKRLAEAPLPEPISNEEYQEIRQKEMAWLEQHYDFSSVTAVNAIPERKNLPRPPGDSATGDVYYYLKYKARNYEANGDIDLAIACFSKSIRLMRLRFDTLYGREESYSYVRMLARNGFVDKAKIEKAYADRFYGPDPRYESDPQRKRRDDSMIEREYQKWVDATTLDWLRENFPDKCPKNVTSFRRMKTQNTKNYQLLKQLAAEKGREI